MEFGHQHQRKLRFWRDLEAFLPRSVPALRSGYKLAIPEFVEEKGQVWLHGLRQAQVHLSGAPTQAALPWTPAALERLKEKHPKLCARPWAYHRVYMGILDAGTIHQVLLEQAPMLGVGGPSQGIARLNMEERWQLQGRHAILMLDLDAAGRLRSRQAIRWSALPFALARLNADPGRELDPSDLDKWINKASTALAARIQDMPISLDFLRQEMDLLRQREETLGPHCLPWLMVESFPNVPEGTPWQPAIPDPINSAHWKALSDLSHELGQSMKMSPPLAAFMGSAKNESERQDWLNDPSALERELDPQQIPDGIWPSRRKRPALTVAAEAYLRRNLVKKGLCTLHTPPGTTRWGVL